MSSLLSLIMRKTHRYFLLVFLITYTFSSHVFSYDNDTRTYYKCKKKAMIGFSITPAPKLKIIFKGGKTIAGSKCTAADVCFWNFSRCLEKSSIYPGKDFFEVKNKNGDGMKFMIKKRSNNCHICSAGPSPSCSGGKMFRGAEITDIKPIGKGLKLNVYPNTDTLNYDIDLYP